MKKHEILSQLESDLEGIPRTTEVKVGKTKFKLRLLSRSEETRARSMVDAENLFTAFADSNVPQLGFAITEVNDTPVEQLFTPSTDDEREAHEDNPRTWRARQMVDWLSSLDGIVAETIWFAYLDMKREAQAALKEMKDFSKKTPSGE